MTSETEVGPHSAFHRYIGLPISRVICWFLFLILGPMRVLGRESLPRKGGLLILANHLADVDPIAVQLACPRPIHFMAKSELFSMPVLGWVIRQFGAFPVKRGAPDRASLKRAVDLLRAGEVVCVFPEGQLSENGQLQELKPGIALLARMGEVPVVCCGLQNTNRIMPYRSVIPRPSLHFTWAKWGKLATFSKAVEPEEIVAWADAELRRLTAQSTASPIGQAET